MESLIKILPVIGSLISVIAGYYFALKFIQEKSYNIKNGVKLLLIEKPEAWNELRLKFPNWKPDLSKKDFSKLDLSYANFSNLALNNVNFSKAKITGCNFSNAEINNTNFALSDLSESNFTNANLSNSNFSNAKLDKVIFNAAILKGALLDKGIDYKAKTKDELNVIEGGIDSFVDNLSPLEFEIFVSELFKKLGYETLILGDMHDGGKDIILKRKDPLGEYTFIVEVKKYSKDKEIGLNVIRQLIFRTDHENANKGILVTNSQLSKGAVELANTYQRIQVIDREKLFELIKNTVPNKG